MQGLYLLNRLDRPANSVLSKPPDQRFYRLWVVEDHVSLQMENSGPPLELAGTLWFFPKRFKPGIAHQEIEGFTFWFDDTFINHNPILSGQTGPWSIRKPLILPTSTTYDTIRQICRDHFPYLSDVAKRQHPLAYTAATLLLLHLRESLRSTLAPFAKKVDPILVSFQELLDTHYRTCHQPNFYADKLHITVATLRRHCQEGFAQSPSELIQQKLIEEAKRLLLDTNQAVKEIAYGLGFEDESYFVRFFRQHALLPPRAFRRSFLPN